MHRVAIHHASVAKAALRSIDPEACQGPRRPTLWPPVAVERLLASPNESCGVCPRHGSLRHTSSPLSRLALPVYW